MGNKRKTQLLGRTQPGKTVSPFNGEALNKALKGLNSQISIINSGDILKANRFDGEYFKPEYLEIESFLKIKGCNFLFNISDVKGGKRLPLGENFSIDGIPYIRAEDIKNNFVQYENVPRISEKLHNKLFNYQTKKDDILLTIVGNSIGDVGIVKFELKKCNLTENACKITKLKKINPDTLFIYMLSKYGQNQIHRAKVGTAQPKLALERIRNLKIPLLPESFQLQIEKIVKEAHQKQTQAKQLYKQAEQILLEELQLINYNPKHMLTFETTANNIKEAVRIDADYFQPKYQDIEKKIENYKGGWDFAGNILNFNKKNFFPKEEKFYNYIPLAKVSNYGEIEIPEKELGKYLPTRARIKVKNGEIILSSIEGSLKTSALIREEHNDFIVSNGFYVFNSEKINSETLFVLFKLEIMIELLRQISKGAILGGYDLTSFEKIKIPIISPQIQEQIAERIKESHKLRQESKNLLEEAKKRVEQEIEKAANN